MSTQTGISTVAKFLLKELEIRFVYARLQFSYIWFSIISIKSSL